MKSDRYMRRRERRSIPRTLPALWLAFLGLSLLPPTEAAANVTLWDTTSPLADSGDLNRRDTWKAVPSNLLSLEKDPLKASSDPGYYGREYEFQGDAVVENHHLIAAFWSARGRVVLFAKDGNNPLPGSAAGSSIHGRKIAELSIAPAKTRPATFRHIELLRHGGDEVALQISFGLQGEEAEVSAVFVLGKTEIVEIKPAERMPAMRLLTSFAYGVGPSFVGDDLIIDPAAHPSAASLALPSENLFLGLVEGGNNMLVMTWPKGRQRITLGLSGETPGGRFIESMEFDHGGQSFYLASLQAPGIWHREPLKPVYLEKDVASAWKRPFSAKWKTQLDEAGVRTAFTFRETKTTVWRGVPGSYAYPAWFQDEQAFFHLSKKVPPRGEALIYFLEGQNTPPSISTPVDILKSTLGRPMSDAILDIAGRKLRTHHRRGGEGARRSCTCGHTEVIQAYFEMGEEVAKKEDIGEALEDMIYFVRRHVERIEEYQRFAADTLEFLQARGKAAPAHKPILDSLAEIARRIPQEYEVQQENMKSLDHAQDLARQTMALTGQKKANNLSAYMELLKAWRAMGGAQDYVLAQCHTITRQLYQEAANQFLNHPEGMPVAEELRTRCRLCLRNPDGYEIWADY